jgi:hypothetical protein
LVRCGFSDRRCFDLAVAVFLSTAIGNGEPNWQAREASGQDVQRTARRVAAFDSKEEAYADAAKRRERSGAGYAYVVM